MIYKKISELGISLIDGDRGKNYPSSEEFFENEYCLFLDASNVTTNGFDFTSTHFITKEKDNLLRAGKLKRNDIVMTTRGTVGNIALYDESVDYENVRINSGMIILRSNRINPKVLYYYLKSDYVSKQIANYISGSVQHQLTASIINDIKVLSDEIDISLLNSINKKIQNNNKIISELESMAKTLYDYWFLQFEFPNEEGKPYKSSGGKMVWNEELKRDIPEGWEVKNIKDFAKVTWGQCPDGINILPLDTKEESVLYCSGAGDMRNGFVVDCQARTNASRRKAYKDDILMSVAGSIGALCVCDKEISLGRAAVSFTPPKGTKLYTYFLISMFVDRMKSISSGSIQKVVNDNHLDDMMFAYNERIINNFSKFNNIFDKLIQINKENQELSSLRDFLLPLLMNGQATFKEIN